MADQEPKRLRHLLLCFYPLGGRLLLLLLCGGGPGGLCGISNYDLCRLQHCEAEHGIEMLPQNEGYTHEHQGEQLLLCHYSACSA
jgi:hypothetical protein